MPRIASYAYLHDKILKQYRRASLYLAWGAAFSLLALIFYIGYIINSQTPFGIGGAYNIASNLAILLWQIFDLEDIVYLIFLLLFDIGLGIFFVICSAKAHQGNQKFLIIGTIAYSIDALVLAFSPLFNSFQAIDYLLSIITHLIILFFCGRTFFKRHQLYALASSQKNEILLPKKSDEEVIKILSYRKPKRELDKKEVFGADGQDDGEEIKKDN